MSTRFVRWLVVLVLFLGIGRESAHAADAFSSLSGTSPTRGGGAPMEAGFDLSAYRVSHAVYGVGAGLGVLGAGMIVGALGQDLCLISFSGGCGAGPTLYVGGLTLLALGAVVSSVGTFANASVVRRGGIDMSTGLAVASVLLPLSSWVFAIGLLAGGYSSALMPALVAGHLAGVLCGGLQLLVGAEGSHHERANARRLTLGVVPMVGPSPGLALTASW